MYGFHQCSLMPFASTGIPWCILHSKSIMQGGSKGTTKSLVPNEAGRPMVENKISYIKGKILDYYYLQAFKGSTGRRKKMKHQSRENKLYNCENCLKLVC